MAKAAKKARTQKRERREQRFFPRATASPLLVALIGGGGGLALGAGSWAQWGRVAFGGASDPLGFAWWLIAAGAVLVGIAIWIGTSGEPLLRVGDGGIVVERGGVFGTLPARRMAWQKLERLAYDAQARAIVATGLDEASLPLTVRASLSSQPQAAAWMAREASKRVPGVVTLGDEVPLPEARPGAGESLVLEPLQVVGKRCAASGTILAFEPDARVCQRCERVYHKDHLPESCACGAPLEHRTS